MKSMSKTIKGYSKEIQTFTGNIDFKSLQEKIQETEKIAEKTAKKIGYEKYDNKNIERYINAYNEVMALHPRMKPTDKRQLTNKKIENQDFWMKAKIDTTEAKREIRSFRGTIEQETDKTVTTQNKWSSFFGAFKQKIGQMKTNISSIKDSFKGMPKITLKITNNIKNIGNGLKNGLGHVLKYAGALLSLRGIYSTLSSCAQSWLSSQNAGAKQLSANIDYMKYAMGSALAPVIQFVTNLVYQLMRAIQSVAYALTGVNIFAKASATAYASMAGNAKKTKNETKALAGIHNEINNISDNNSDSGSGGSVTPSFDLSGIDNTPNSIIDAIKNGNWYEVGATIGQKLNDAMNSIPWESIQNTAKSIGTNIAQFLNGFIAIANWNQIGNTFAEGLNTVIYFAYNFVTTFNWEQFGQSIVNGINGILDGFDWGMCGKTIGEFVKGLLDIMVTFMEEYDFQKFPDKIAECLANVDWSGIIKKIFELLGAALLKVSVIGAVMNVSELILKICNLAVEYFEPKVEECGGNIIAGIFKGIGDAIINIGQWIYDNIFKPFIDGFKNAFGIHSPSTVMEEQGHFIIEGLKNGLTGIWEKVAGIFTEFGEKIKTKFNEIKGKISDICENIKNTTKEKWSNIKENVTTTCENIRSKVKEKFDNIKGKVTETWSNIKNDKNLSSMSSTIHNTFNNLGENASTWGRDLVSNMATGIKNNIHKVTNAVTSVANKIKSFLHFTEPDEGPLSNFHTYMPDMIDLMVNGIKSNTNKIKSEMESLAGTMSYTINAEAVTNIPSTNAIIKPINTQSSNMFSMLNDMMAYKEGDNDRPIYLTVKVGDRVLGEILLNDLRNKKRQTGKDIEAIIGD